MVSSCTLGSLVISCPSIYTQRGLITARPHLSIMMCCFSFVLVLHWRHMYAAFGPYLSIGLQGSFRIQFRTGAVREPNAFGFPLCGTSTFTVVPTISVRRLITINIRRLSPPMTFNRIPTFRQPFVVPH